MSGAGGSVFTTNAPSREDAQALTARLCSAPATDAEFDPHAHLAELLGTVGLSANDAGGSVDFVGADPVLPDVLRLAGATGIALVAKSIAVAALWRMRGGAGQDIAMDLRVAPRRLCPFYEQRWELLNGYAMRDPAQVSAAFGIPQFYRTADDRWMHPMAPYPGLRNRAARLLGVPEDTMAVAEAIGQWNALDLEAAGEEAGVIMPMCRTTDELIDTEQYRDVLSLLPPVSVERIGDSDPEPLSENSRSPLEGVRALGRAHVIAGAGAGRALALHGADVLNVWNPNEYEIPLLYATSHVGMRSTMLDSNTDDGAERIRGLLRDADIFFANRRPGYLTEHGLDAESAAQVRPGIIHATVNLNGESGPWAGRIGFDQTAGALAGLLIEEGDDGVPALPQVPVVNDYITAWFLQIGILRALMLRAEHGGSYKVTVSLTRTALWVRSLGLIDRDFARSVAGAAPGHEYLPPQTFTAQTPLGRYQGVTDQVVMTQTPGSYAYPLIPRGSEPPVWLDRSQN